MFLCLGWKFLSDVLVNEWMLNSNLAPGFVAVVQAIDAHPSASVLLTGMYASCVMLDMC